MVRRALPRCRARGGEGIPPKRPPVASIALGGGGFAVAAALSVWLTTIASPEIARPVGGLACLAVAVLVTGLVLGRREAIAPALFGLGAAYAVVLALDDPPLDPRAAIVGATLLTIGELSNLAVDVRPALGDDGTVVRRVGWVAATALAALAVGGVLIVAADLVHTGGIATEVTGAAAAAAAVALLVRRPGMSDR